MPIVIQPSPEEFLEACGARPPLRLEIEHCGWGSVKQRTLHLPFALIGRHERADIPLEDRDVSRKHVYLQMIDGRWWWVDLDSRTGTYSQRYRSSSVSVLDGQGIRIGPYVLRLAQGESARVDEPYPTADPLSPNADDSMPRLALHFCNGAMQEMMWTLDRPLTLVGRAAFCRIRLNSSMVSRTHCALLNTTAGLWVVDLMARKGTLVDGRPVRWAKLQPGDELQIDTFRIRVGLPSSLPSSMVEGSGARKQPKIGVSERPALIHKPCQNGALPAQTLVSAIAPLPENVNESMLLPLVNQFSLMQQQMFDQFQQTLLMMAQTFGKLHQDQMDVIRQELAQIRELTRQLHALQTEGMRQTPLPQPASPQTQTATSKSKAISDAADAPVPPVRDQGDVHSWLAQRLVTLQQERQTRWQKILNLVTGK